CQALSDSLCAVTNGFDGVPRGQIFPEIYPGVEVEKNQTRLAGQPAYWLGDQQSVRHGCVVQSFGGLEVRLRLGYGCVQAPGKNPRRRREAILACNAQDVAIAAAVIGRSVGPINPAGFDPALAIAE